MKRRWLKRLLIVLGVPAALIAIAVTVLQTPLVARLMFNQVRNYLHNKSGIDLKCTRFDFSLFRQTATLENIVIRSTSSPELPPVFKASKIHVQLGVLNTIRGLIDLEQLQITSPEIQYFIAGDSKTNFPIFTSSNSGGSAKFLISSGEINKGSFRFEDARSKTVLTIPDWQLSMSGDRNTLDHEIRITTQKESSFIIQKRSLPINRFSFQGTLRKSELQIRTMEAAFFNSRIRMNGSVRNFSSPELSLQISPNLELNKATQFLGMKRPVEGNLAGAVTVNGKPDALLITAHLQGRNINAGEYKNQNLTLKTRAELLTGRALLHSIEIDSPEGSLRGSGQFSIDSTSGDSNSIAADLRNVNLFTLWKHINPPFNLASRGSGKVSLNWKGSFDLSRINGSAHLNLVATRSDPSTKLLPMAGTLDARIQSDRIHGALQDFSAAGAKLDGEFTLTSLKTIDAHLHGNASEIDRLINQLSKFFNKPGESPATAPLAGPVRFDAEFSGNLSHPIITILAEAPELQASAFKRLNVKTNATIEGTRIDFQTIVSLPQHSIVTANGTLETGGTRTELTLDAFSEKTPASDVLASLGSTVPASGAIESRLHISGPVDALAGRASLIGKNLSIYNEPLGQLDVEVHLADGVIHSNRFKVIRDPEHPDTDSLDAQFTYAAKTDEFTFNVDGKDLLLSRQSFDGRGAQGKFSLTASGNGSIDHPSINAKLESGDFSVQQKSIGPIAIEASLLNEEATIKTSAPRLNLDSQFSITAHTPFPFIGNVHITNPDLSQLQVKLAEDQLLAGTIEAHVTGSGDLKNPEKSSITLLMPNLQLKNGNLEIHTEGPFQAEYQDGTVEILKPAIIVSGKSRLEIAGKAPLKQQASNILTLKGQIDLSQAAGFWTAPDKIAADGIVNLDIALSGTPKELSGSGAITMNNGTLRLAALPTPISNIALLATIQDGSLVLKKADAAFGDAGIAIKGEFPLGLLPKKLPIQFIKSDSPAGLVLDLTNLKPEATGTLPDGVTGLISLHAEGQATEFGLHSLKAVVVFNDLLFKANEIEIKQKEPSTILVHDGVASISRFTLSGSETNIEATGSAGLLPDSPMDLKLAGDFNTALLTFKDTDLKAAGKARIQLTIGGTHRSPTFSGKAEMDGGRLTLRNPRVVADSLTVKLDLTPEKISIREFNGTLNGGSLIVTGTVGYKNRNFDDFNLKAALQDVFFDFPEGLKSSSSGDLTFTSQDDLIIAGGTIRVQDSSYREPFSMTGQLMSYLKSQSYIEEKKTNSLLDRVRLNISLRTTTPLLVHNNIAKVEGSANLRLLGTIDEPSLTGRIRLTEGGEIVLNQRTYYINRGNITLNDQTQIKPELDIQAQTKISNYDITLQLTGPAEKPTTTLRSEPQMSEQDIISLLLTGKVNATDSDPNSTRNEISMVRTQALSLIAGQAGEELTREARQALHLSTLRIDPGTIAANTEEGARLTLGEDITNNLSFVYSMNLRNGGDQIWAAKYDVTRRFNLQATKQQDNSYRFELLHDLRFGGTATRRTSHSEDATTFIIGAIRFNGVEGTPAQKLQDKFDAKPGDKYEFPKVQKGLDKLHEFYAGQKRLEADIRLRRETNQNTVDLNLNVNPGPSVTFTYEGMPLSQSIKKDVEKSWTNGVFDIERLDDAGTIIHRSLLQQGYLQSKISHTIETEEDKKTVHFTIAPGIRYTSIPVTFPGASQIKSEQLYQSLDKAGLGLDIYSNPRKVADYLKRYYQQRGFLQAEVELPKPELDPAKSSGKVLIAIHEGPQFIVGDLQFSGNAAFDYDQLWSVIPTSSGSIFDPDNMQDAVKALENFYHSQGYNDITATYRTVQTTGSAKADVAFMITERRKSIIRDIVIEGNQRTNVDFVQAQLDFHAGDALNYNQFSDSRRRLYSTGVYNSADFQTEEMPDTPGSREKNIRVRVRLREVRPYRLQYGYLFDTERKHGGIVELQDLNVMGRASTLGLRFRYDSDLKEARLYLNQPFVNKIHLKMDAAAFVQQEDRSGFKANRIGFSLFREKELTKKFFLDYGYRYDHVRWGDQLPPDPTLFQAETPVARLIATITRDTRDSILDATRGEFMSHSFEFGPRWLGSEIGFARYYGQYFKYVPLEKYLRMRTKDEEGKPLPSSLIYAGALRLGLTSAFDHKTVISPERFFAGGGTTMRGFKQDLLGPTVTIADNTGMRTVRPEGGEALFLFNNEIRFPIVGMLQGVTFMDIGNVYSRLSDFNFNLRKSAGAGLRMKIKFIPLRFDYGLKLDRKPGESKGEFFFSIGQAF
jgi:outer membrane protein assembly complex protein YaeT